jgi:phosphoribosylformylglycinamidine cyclo-ligase
MRSTYGPAVIESPWGFAGLFSMAGAARGMKDPILVACADGVGTKLKLAVATGNHSTVGIDLVAMSVNDLICTGGRPLFFLDYIATGRVRPETLGAVIKGIVRGCREAGCALLGGETAEMPGMYADGDYDLAGFAVGIVDRSRMIDPRSARIGDRIVGLASSGVHSNGYSLVRKIVETAGIAVEGATARMLLTPTRIYVKAVCDGLGPMLGREIRSLANITGNALPGNLPRALGPGLGALLRLGRWPVPKVFRLLQAWGGVSDAEMRGVFNLGIGMCLVAAPKAVEKAIGVLKRFGIEAWEIGEVVRGNGDVAFV